MLKRRNPSPRPMPQVRLPAAQSVCAVRCRFEMERKVIFMLTSNEHSIQKQAKVDFTRSGWRQFAKLNRRLGARFIRGFVLRYELAAYLTAHEAAGVELDEGCQEVRYDHGVYVLLRRTRGVWYVTDVFAAEEAVAYEPVFFWQKIRRGAEFILAHVLSGWRQLTERMVLNG